MAKKTATSLPPIGDVILAWRKFRGFSSTKLADKAGVRIAYLSEIEHNKTAYPREQYLEKLAIALEVPLQDIYGRRMPPENGRVGVISQSQEGEVKERSKEATSGIVFHTPLATKRQKILMHRIAVLERKLETIEKNLRTAQEEVRELGALAKDMFREE
jgi:transcriptional regulator with XRE-family HTH domain